MLPPKALLSMLVIIFIIATLTVASPLPSSKRKSNEETSEKAKLTEKEQFEVDYQQFLAHLPDQRRTREIAKELQTKTRMERECEATRKP